MKSETWRVAIQGERGSNSHMAALGVAGSRGLTLEVLPCAVSAEVFRALEEGAAAAAILPIENSLHGTVAEHNDLLLASGAAVTGESLLRIRFDVMAAPGVTLADIRRVLSHPVALSQCRRWMRAHPDVEPVAAYDTAGSVKQLMERGWRDAAGIAPPQAALEYGAETLAVGIEDHAMNFTRFLEVERRPPAAWPRDADKMSLAFAVEHRPGTLLRTLEVFAAAGLNLTRIESRPVPGRPWEYVFFADLRFAAGFDLGPALEQLTGCCEMVRVLGRYRAAGEPVPAMPPHAAALPGR